LIIDSNVQNLVLSSLLKPSKKVPSCYSIYKPKTVFPFKKTKTCTLYHHHFHFLLNQNQIPNILGIYFSVLFFCFLNLRRVLTPVRLPTFSSLEPNTKKDYSSINNVPEIYIYEPSLELWIQYIVCITTEHVTSDYGTRRNGISSDISILKKKSAICTANANQVKRLPPQYLSLKTQNPIIIANSGLPRPIK